MLVPLLALAVGCAGSNTIPTPRRDQGPVLDLSIFDTQSWLTDTNVAFNTCAASCAGCCMIDGSCEAGESHTVCGLAGGLCKDCTAAGQYCVGKLCQACNPTCANKACGASDGCGGTCNTGSGCCTPTCGGKICGAADGCGGACNAGSGCCTPLCGGKLCGAADGCGGTCGAGSGCCTPNCNILLCGQPDSCGGICQPGSGCCAPNCNNKQCGVSDGCGGTCAGSCAANFKCNSSHTCVCEPSPQYKVVGGACLPSCGQLLANLGVSVPPGDCCTGGCNGANGGATWDCNYCCPNGC